MEFVATSAGLPVGAYTAEFVGAEPFTEKAEYGPGVALRFRVSGGAHAGEEASRICSAKLTPKSTLGKFAVALKGSAIQTGERFNFANFAGVAGTILVEATESGGSRISTFLKQA
jgi:hypothetical protein